MIKLIHIKTKKLVKLRNKRVLVQDPVNPETVLP